jgi:hypothetical protein
MANSDDLKLNGFYLIKVLSQNLVSRDIVCLGCALNQKPPEQKSRLLALDQPV